MMKHHQTRCPNGKMFGNETMFDRVLSPNISRSVAFPPHDSPLFFSHAFFRAERQLTEHQIWKGL